jgi:hypothetical protein
MVALATKITSRQRVVDFGHRRAINLRRSRSGKKGARSGDEEAAFMCMKPVTYRQ